MTDEEIEEHLIEFGNHVADMRSFKGMSLAQVAKQAGVGVTTVHRTEQGKLRHVVPYLKLRDWLEGRNHAN